TVERDRRSSRRLPPGVDERVHQDALDPCRQSYCVIYLADMPIDADGGLRHKVVRVVGVVCHLNRERINVSLVASDERIEGPGIARTASRDESGVGKRLQSLSVRAARRLARAAP